MNFSGWRFPIENCTIFSDLCSNTLIIDSNGIAREHLDRILGKYHYYQSSDGRPKFKQNNYRLKFDSDDRWKVCYTNIQLFIVSEETYIAEI